MNRVSLVVALAIAITSLSGWADKPQGTLKKIIDSKVMLSATWPYFRYWPVSDRQNERRDAPRCCLCGLENRSFAAFAVRREAVICTLVPAALQ